ncbi:hypothetical protein GCM10028805_52450 [Spirosoma harenae]
MDKSKLLIAIESELLSDVVKALNDATAQMKKQESRESELQIALDRATLYAEQQAQTYLNRAGETLRYYRLLGLSPLRKKLIAGI